jgi:hypothetical protein
VTVQNLDASDRVVLLIYYACDKVEVDSRNAIHTNSFILSFIAIATNGTKAEKQQQ